MPHRPVGRTGLAAPLVSSGSSRVGRRRVLAAGVGGLLVAVGGCGGDDDQETPVALTVGTPAGPVPGFDDPRRWTGRTLRVGAWGGEVQQALREAVWLPFGAATGAAIAEVVTDYSLLVDDSGLATPSDTYAADALIVDPFWAATALAKGFVRPLDAGLVAPETAAVFGAGEGSVPAFAYALVNAYRRDAIAERPPAGWAQWWDAERFPGPRALARQGFGTFEIALLADGVEPAALYPLDGPRAIESLRRISGRIVERWWDSGAQPVGWLRSGRADFASSWHYRVIAGQRDGVAVDLVWDQGLLVADHWVVPSGAQAPDVAIDFLRFALRPEVQAALARRVPLGPVVPAAFEELEPRLAALLPTAPPTFERLVRPDVAWWAANAGEANGRFNAWLLGVPYE